MTMLPESNILALQSIPHKAGRPAYQKPHLLHTYTHGPRRELEHGTPPMAYWAGAPLGADLNNGFGQRLERDPRLNEHLDGLCEGLVRYVREKGALKKSALVTWRGMLTRLVVAAYNDRDSWEMNALALDGNVYLEDHTTIESIERKISQDQNSALMGYHGYAFESYSTVRNASQNRRTAEWTEDMVVNTNEQWCCIAKSRIGKTRLYMGGEVDCVEGEWRNSLSSCVELKTNMVIRDKRGQVNFERKLMKHWAQSHLLSVPTVEVGFRDGTGILRQVQRFKTEDLPKLVGSSRENRPPWSDRRCLETFEALAGFIADTILPSDPIPGWRSLALEDRMKLPKPVIWRIRFQPGRGIELRIVDEDLPVDARVSRWGFLPLSFVEELVDAP